MPVNREKIITLLAEIEKTKEQLEQYRAIGSSTILDSSEKLNSLKYLFIVLIEACVDICQHCSSKLFSEVPESYRECFLVLSKHDVIPNTMAKRMAEFAGFRNLLVHRYWEVDDALAVKQLKDIGTFDEYARAIAAHVGILSGGNPLDHDS